VIYPFGEKFERFSGEFLVTYKYKGKVSEPEDIDFELNIFQPFRK